MTTECIQQHIVLNAGYGTNCPVDVCAEVSDKLWSDMELGNDFYYYSWYEDEELVERYPAIAAYLKSRGITECLIHYCW